MLYCAISYNLGLEMDKLTKNICISNFPPYVTKEMQQYCNLLFLKLLFIPVAAVT